MTTATMTTVDAILKEVYGPRIEDQLNEELVVMKRIERTSDGVVETVGGKYVDFPVRVSRNTGIGYRQENETLPTAGVQGYAEVHVPLKYGYTRGRVTGQLMQLADKNYQAFASGLDREMDGAKNDTLKDANRIHYGNGTGLLATVVSDGANNVVVSNTQYLEIGMLIDIRTISDGTAIALARTITAIVDTTYPAGTVTYDGANVTASSTDGIFREGNFASGTSREPTGFNKIVAAGILHTLDAATQPKWQGVVRNNPLGAGTLRALSEGLMIELCDAVRRNGAKTTAIFTSLGVRRAYFNLLTQQRRYTDTKSFAGGFQGLPFNYGTEIPVVEDTDAPPNTMWFMAENELKIYRNKEWHFVQEDGTILKWVHDLDAFEYILRCYWELGTSRRNGHGRLNDITEG